MMTRKHLSVHLLFIFLALSLAACVSSSPAPVHSDDRGLREPVNPYRVVVPGDTLFSIAWETGRDYRQLAEWNNIDSSYLIKPGQKIWLHSPAKATAQYKTRKHKSSRYRVKKGDTIYSIARRNGLTVSELARLNGLRSPYRIYPGQKLALKNKGGYKEKVAGKSATTKAKSRSANRSQKPYRGKWLWPTNGKLIGRYTGKGKKKGIDISGKRGQVIRASATGKVVYQGSGLRGYGKLIILKHDDDYLSAYAHCENIVVKEGDMIKQGNKIAAMGDSGTDRVKLHFEIRYKGNPVNPMKFLVHR